MLRTYRQQASCSPSKQKDSYIYSIVPVEDTGLAAITSANELLLVNRHNLETVNAVRFDDAPTGLTTLVTAQDGRLIICGGNDGTVSTYDVRSGPLRTHSFRIDKGVTALATKGYELAVGTELAHQQAVASVWDLRRNRIQWQNAENNDDITAVDFHPSKPNSVLCGGDDGLVSMFDTSITEEEDSLLQAVNHGPIHKAGFFGDSAIYALSSDQNLALHPIYLDERDEEPAPILIGDLRPIIPCEYVIDLFQSGQDMVVAAGSHSKSRVDLITVKGDGKLDLDNRIILDGAHGEEIVRSIYSDSETGVVFTAGEDGCIKAFNSSETTNTGSKTTKGSKVKKQPLAFAESRYKPY